MNLLRSVREMFARPKPARARREDPNRARLRAEEFESRLVPYAVTGNMWPSSQVVTISFVPDGTVIGTQGTQQVTSNLFSTFNTRFGSAAAWQNVILRAAQAWAQQTNVNFTVVADDGVALGTGAYQQGDPNHGDIRIGGYNFQNSILANAFSPPAANNYDIAGDIRFNTAQPFNIGSTYDLFTVATHEIGHALGLGHSTIVSAQMYSAYGGVKNNLTTDDINGVRAIYGGARVADAYDANGANGSFATADDISGTVSGTTYTAVLSGLDVSTTSDVDYYKITGATPTDGGNVTVNLQSTGLSLLAGSLKVYAADMVTLLGSATGSGTAGGTLSVTFSGLAPGSTFYVVVDGADNTAFGTGAYALTVNTGTGANPTVPLPNTSLLNDPNRQAGGGIADAIQFETAVTADGSAVAPAGGQRQVAMDAAGNYAVVYAAAGQDGSQVMARLYYADGTARTDAFAVGNPWYGAQTDPAVAMAADGSFVVSWSTPGMGGALTQNVFARRFAADGTALGDEFLVNETAAAEEAVSAVAVDAAGNITVAWTGFDGDGTGVFARRFAADGTALGGEFQVNATAAGNQSQVQVGVNAAGATVFTWTADGPLLTGTAVVGRVFTAAGQGGAEFRVNTQDFGNQSRSSVAVAANGQFVVTYSSNLLGAAGSDVYAQRFTAAGAKSGAEFKVNGGLALGDQTHSQVAVDAGGNFTVVWGSDGQDGSGWGVYGRQFTNKGVAYGSEFLVNTTTAGDQRLPSLAFGTSGHLVVSWYGDAAGGGTDVLFQRFDTTTSAMTAGAEVHGLSVEGCDDHDHGHGAEGGDEDHACGCTACVNIPGGDAGPADAAPASPMDSFGCVAMGGGGRASVGVSGPVAVPSVASLPPAAAAAPWWASVWFAPDSDDLDTLLGGVAVGQPTA